MSTLKVTNIQDTGGGNSSTSAEIYSGRAKAWVNFNGTGVVAIRASFNVSSLADLGTGVYSITFTSALGDANYSVACSSNPNNYNGAYTGSGSTFGGTNSSTTAYLETRRVTDGTVIDSNYVCASIFR